ncbi:unnamed protein product [Urochloa humidicola]
MATGGGGRAAAVWLMLLVLCALRQQEGAAAQRYNAIWSFGDSISDTGNLCVGGCPSWLTTGQSPYGETFFGRPTGRCSDGRVIIDFLAEHFGLPLLPASKAGGDFKKGANMAIIGATTMNFDFFNSIGLSDKIWNNGPLDTQIQWFRQLLPSVCGKDCKNYLSKSLFVVGEFGGNDYNAALFSGRTMSEVRGYVPRVVSKLIRGLETIIRSGAVDVVVPGVLPIGCFPIYITLYGTSNGADYDGDGCLKSYNGLSYYHNALLKRSLASLQRTYPHARIMYADFYSHDQGPSKLWAQVRPQGVLRRRRAGQVQLQQQGAVRHGRSQRLRRPRQLPHLGRHPPHGGGLPLHRRRLAQGPLLQPSHSALIDA